MLSRESPLSLRFWRDPVDARPAALLRIALGLELLYDLCERLTDFHAFYSNAGIVPPSAVKRWSLFLLLPSLTWAKVFYAFGLLAVLCYAVGYRTRLANLCAWVFMMSLNHRNPLVLNGADSVVRLTLMWSLFIDQGAQYSIDVLLKRRPAYATIAPLGLRFLQLQIALIYLGALLSKLDAHWLDGTAIYLTLQSPTYTRPLARLLLDFPAVCFALTAMTLAIEGWFPALVFFPIKNRLCRGIALLSGIGLHLGIYVLMRVGQFSIVMLITYLAFVRREWLDRVLPASVGLGAPPQPALVRRALLVVLGAHFVWALLLVLHGAPEDTTIRPRVQKYANVLGYEQNWGMFYQPPLTKLRWSAYGTTDRGERRDVLARAAPSFAASHTWFNTRWTKLQTELANRPNDLKNLGPYLCRRYRAEGEAELVMLEIYLHQEEARFPNDPTPRDSRVELALVQPCR